MGPTAEAGGLRRCVLQRSFLDFEAEMAVVIGRTVPRYVRAEAALQDANTSDMKLNASAP